MSADTVAIRKPLAALTTGDEAHLFDRGRAADPDVQRTVASIIADVRGRGDAALREMAERYDGVRLDALAVPADACKTALEALDPDVSAALEQAADAIAAFHRAQLPPPFEVEVRPGVRLGRRTEPLRRVGVYAPGGRASYPSSVLMGVVPARTAGVEDVVVCSPPSPDSPHGHPPTAVLAACALAGADRVFALGGAGAIAALAHGTDSVPRVDKVVGPGNAYVTEAKRQLAGTVVSDCPAGPSEVLVVADESADPEIVAIELLAQAEHDPDAAAVLVTTSDDVAAATRDALARLLPEQPRREVIEPALAARGALLTAADLNTALAFAERYAPEHLLLLVREPRRALERVRAAGTVFLGAHSSVAFGDYLTGANHVLPTAGRARAYSGLSTADFLRWSTYQEVSDGAARALAAPTATLAEAEGLSAHALAARMRAKGEGAGDGVLGQPRAGRRPQTEYVDSAGGGAPTGAERGRGGAEGGRAGYGRRESRSDEESPIAGAQTANPATPRRAAYRTIDLYQPDRRPCDVDLSDNTNLFGPSPAASEAMAGLGPDALTCYPPVYATRLKTALAERHSVAPDNIVTGCGSDDVIDSALRAFCEPGDAVAYTEPTFSVVPTFARMNAARPVGVPPGPDFALDADAMLATRGRVTYVCRPNNPTGTLADRAVVERLAREASGIVTIDEAYADFGADTLVREAAASERMVVLRTFSKAYGLAGLRVGYAVGPAPLIREITKSRGPYKVSTIAEAAAVAALTEDEDWVRRVNARVRENRTRLATDLKERGLRTWPSAANFLLVGVPHGLDTAGITAALREQGVAVRPFPALQQAGDCVRVTIGPWQMMARFIQALEEVTR